MSQVNCFTAIILSTKTKKLLPESINVIRRKRNITQEIIGEINEEAAGSSENIDFSEYKSVR